MTLTVVLAVAAVAAAYWLIHLRTHPYGPCPSCRGRRGRGVGSTGRAWSRCYRCGGSGERLRPGARLWARNRELK